MPRTTKTKTNNAAAKPQAKKGSTSGRKQSKKSSGDVAEMLKTLNQKILDTSSQQSSSEPAKRATGKGQKNKASKESTANKSGSPTGRRKEQTVTRGGRGKGTSGGSSEQTRDAADALQEDVQTSRGTEAKRQQKKKNKNQEEISVARGEGSPTKRKRRTKLRDALDDEDYLERQVSAQNVAKWQTMTKTSQEFLNQIVDSAITVTLNETSGSAYNDIQDHLNNLKTRLMKSFVSLKVPNRRRPNYREMEQQAHILDVALVETNNQVEGLDSEVQLQQELLEQKEEELEKLEAAEPKNHHDNDKEITKKLHPLLQDTRQDVLGLPPPRRSRHSNASSAQFEDIRSSCQQHVVESLRHVSRTQDEGVVEMTEFVDAISAVRAALP